MTNPPRALRLHHPDRGEEQRRTSPLRQGERGPNYWPYFEYSQRMAMTPAPYDHALTPDRVAAHFRAVPWASAAPIYAGAIFGHVHARRARS